MLLFLCVSSVGIAFDNHRRGFIIGGLGGGGLTIWKDFEYETEVENGTNFTLHTDFRIGGGFKDDKFMLYFWGVTNWWFYDEPEQLELILEAFMGVGGSYYFKPISPSFYINAGYGHFNSGGEAKTGPGIMGGIGYEFAPHWSTEIGIMYSIPSYSYYKLRISVITLSIIGIAY